MTRHYTAAEVVTLVDDLTERRLQVFVREQIVQPLQTDSGPAYRDADIARLRLLCDLLEGYELKGDAMHLVMSLVDQLNTARGDMRALMHAVAEEPDEVRLRIHRIVHRLRD
ncbi:hypothetical protein PAF17_02980 [Paracoccus sp. Z330]|uniref:Chaperone modulatory protein CbpM n=1 Tax=Paracoccus onchidii TaxID=3017813 RepID=A0ABT4ZB29_9RHOB|nr:hypothetical protein [Paracoccus onchidii]MDB6176465.1 hypothetical protein [Paracoccus onchidii]